MFTIQSNSIQTIKENIMTYFNSTLQEFTYLHEQVTEISNPDESYLGTLNLFFKEPVTSNDEQTYFEESDAFEQYVIEFINSHWDDRAILTKPSGRHSKHLPEPPYL